MWEISISHDHEADPQVLVTIHLKVEEKESIMSQSVQHREISPEDRNFNQGLGKPRPGWNSYTSCEISLSCMDTHDGSYIFVFSREISPLILMQLQITNICSQETVNVVTTSLQRHDVAARCNDADATFVCCVGPHKATSSVKHHSETHIQSQTLRWNKEKVLSDENIRIAHRPR